jgi:outer membrane protein assembly factor BamB
MRVVYVVSLCFCELFCSDSSAGESWSQFRGDTGDGQAKKAQLPIHWSESSDNIRWKTSIAGKAWSSPVVRNDKVWLTSATTDGKRLSAVCVNATTGKIERDITVFEIEKPMFCYPFNSYASCTPVIDDNRLWVHFGSAGTACLDTSNGRILWTRRDLRCDHHRGPGSSPIVHGNQLFLTFDGFDQQYVIALDKRTGETVWKTERDIDYGSDNGDAKKAYSTPTVIEHDGRQQLISPAAVATIAYDPLTGKELWKVYHGGFNAAAKPLYTHGLVILNLEGGMRLLAVRPNGRGDVTKTNIVWKYKKSTPTRPSQLVVGDHLFMISGQGIFTCLDIKTGVATWTQRIGGAYSASPIHANGLIYCFDQKGMAHVLKADPHSYTLMSANQLADGCMASPAVVGNALIVRTKTGLYRIEKQATK